MELEKLSQELISNLRTSIFITSLPACVVELVYNSLDAHATTVDVAVSSRQWSARISDNGDGMQEADLKRLGERYRMHAHCQLNLADEGLSHFENHLV